MTLVTGSVHNDAVPVLHIGRPMSVKGLLNLVHVQLFGQVRADLADDLKIGKPLGPKVNTAEKLPVQVPVEPFHKLSIPPKIGQ